MKGWSANGLRRAWLRRADSFNRVMSVIDPRP